MLDGYMLKRIDENASKAMRSLLQTTSGQLGFEKRVASSAYGVAVEMEKRRELLIEKMSAHPKPDEQQEMFED